MGDSVLKLSFRFFQSFYSQQTRGAAYCFGSDSQLQEGSGPSKWDAVKWEF